MNIKIKNLHIQHLQNNRGQTKRINHISFISISIEVHQSISQISKQPKINHLSNNSYCDLIV